MHKYIRKICIWYFKRSGWLFTGEIPDFEPKSVIISNRCNGSRDFIFAIAVLSLTFFRCSILVDKRYFNFVLNRILRRLSCRPYDFQHSTEEQNRLIEVYKSRKKQSMLFVTRLKHEDSEVFREDFYHIAQKLKIPIIMVSFDKSRKLVKIHSAFLTSDKERDLAFCRKFLREKE